MKINLILPGAGNCGGVRVAFEYMNALTEYGHDVVCYVPACGSYVGWKKILFPKAIIRLICSHDLQGRWFEKRFDLAAITTVCWNCRTAWKHRHVAS